MVVAMIAWAVSEALFGAVLKNMSSKEVLQRIYREIHIGASQADVQTIYERNKTHRTQFKTNLFKDTWSIGMPFEIGASDPLLYIQFDSAGMVSAIAMRTSDGIHGEPPTDFPDQGDFQTPKPYDSKNG
jgi:hypothetical protein